MNPIFKSLAFWKAVSWVIAGVAGLLVTFGVIPSQFGLNAGIVLAGIIAFLNAIQINPELRARGLLK